MTVVNELPVSMVKLETPEIQTILKWLLKP